MSADQSRKESFTVVLTGHIECAKFETTDNIYCKYSYVYGADWTQIGGLEEGISAHCSSTGDQQHQITIGQPIQATFTSTNPFGWPQIVVSCYGLDAFRNDVIRGYGAVHLPTTPGRAIRRVPLFVPEASTTIQKVIGWLSGRRAEFIDARIVASAEGRHVTRVQSQGMMTIAMSIVLKDMKKYGYDVCQSSMQQVSTHPFPDLSIPMNQNRSVASTKRDLSQHSESIEPDPDDGPSSSAARQPEPGPSRPLPIPRIRQKLFDEKDTIKNESIDNDEQ